MGRTQSERHSEPGSHSSRQILLAPTIRFLFFLAAWLYLAIGAIAG